MPKVRFKFRHDAKQDDRLHVLKSLATGGVKGAKPLFPDDTDPELASLFSVEVQTDRVDHAIKLLSSAKPVEFAEPDVVRTLIQPRKNEA